LPVLLAHVFKKTPPFHDAKGFATAGVLVLNWIWFSSGPLCASCSDESICRCVSVCEYTNMLCYVMWCLIVANSYLSRVETGRNNDALKGMGYRPAVITLRYLGCDTACRLQPLNAELAVVAGRMWID